jgi:hypothetical protein
MTDFKDRERAFETKFARDEEMQFRVTARRNRLLGQWAAEKMGLTAEETDAYAKEVVAADFEEAGDEDVIRKLLGDLTSAGVEMVRRLPIKWSKPAASLSKRPVKRYANGKRRYRGDDSGSLPGRVG